MSILSGFPLRPKPLKFNICLSALIFLLILTLAVSYVWLARNTIPPYGDGIRPLLRGLRIFDAWKHHRLTLAGLSSFFEPLYPPLIDLCYAAYFFIFGPFAGKEFLVNTFFLIITLVSIYGIGKAFYGEKVGLSSVAVFLSFPGVFRYSRLGNAEFPLMGMVSFSLLFLVSSSYFSERKYSILCGVVLGLAALAKWSFLPYVAGPLAVVVWHSYQTSKRTCSTKEPVNFFIAFACALMVSLPWYASHLRAVVERFSSDEIRAVSQELFFSRVGVSLFLDNLAYYALPLVSSRRGMYPHIDQRYAAVLLCAALFFVAYRLWKGIRHKQRFFSASAPCLVLSTWIAIPFLFLSFPAFTGVRNSSHALPLLPPLAIAVAAAVFSIPVRPVRYAMAAYAVLIAFPLWRINLCLPFIRMPPEQPVLTRVEAPAFDRENALTVFKKHYDPVGFLQEELLLPDTNPWPHRAILDLIARQRGPAAKETRVLLLGNDGRTFRFYQFEYFNLREGGRLVLFDPRHRRRQFGNPQAFSAAISDSFFDYIVWKATVVVRSPSIGPSETAELKEVIDFIKSRRDDFDGKYQKIKTFVWPASGSVAVYQRRG